MTVQILVCQADDCVTVNAILNVLGSSSPSTVANSHAVYYIGSRAVRGNFFNMEHGPAISPILLDWLSVRWLFEPVVGAGAQVYRIRKLWHDNQSLAIDNGALATARSTTIRLRACGSS